jgi:hypothetical protein
MSDHDTPEHDKPDPLDEAYVDAEALLNDEAERAARRARVLAAVDADAAPLHQVAAAASMAAAASPSEPTTIPNVPPRRSIWRRNSWLAAACVAGLGLFIALKVYQPIQPPRPMQRTPAHVAAGSRTKLVTPPAPGAAPPLRPIATPLVRPAPPLPVIVPRMKAPVLNQSTAPVMAVPPAPQAFPVKPGTEVQEVIVTGSRIPHPAPTGSSPVTVQDRKAARAASAAKPGSDGTSATIVGGASSGGLNAGTQFTYAAPPPPPPPPPPAEAFAPSPPPPGAALDGKRMAALASPELGARLGAASAEGRTSDVKALLADGAPVDAPDDHGDTALMRSVRADKPAVAALLLRHGASLDRKNHAGVSARDMAKLVGDEKLNRALGLIP